MSSNMRTPWEIAEQWYSEYEIASELLKQLERMTCTGGIPADVRSPEFAQWLTHQYRLAMAKGVQLGRDGSQDAPDKRYLNSSDGK